MKKLALAVALMSSFALVGCANTDVFSGSVYSGEQAKKLVLSLMALLFQCVM